MKEWINTFSFYEYHDDKYGHSADLLAYKFVVISVTILLGPLRYMRGLWILLASVTNWGVYARMSITAFRQQPWM